MNQTRVPRERLPPLTIPPQREPLPTTNPVTNRYTQRDGNGRDRGIGVVRGKGERAIVAEAFVRCEQCGWLQKLVFAPTMLPKYHRCLNCRELQPTDGYRIMAYGRFLGSLPLPEAK